MDVDVATVFNGDDGLNLNGGGILYMCKDTIKKCTNKIDLIKDINKITPQNCDDKQLDESVL